MKKILLMLTMVLVLGFSAICSASNGKVLDAEEAKPWSTSFWQLPIILP